jgi:aminoglycoside phosphotransferase
VVGAEWTTIGEGYGLASVTGRLDLRLEEANVEVPSSLVAKLSTPERWEQAAREVRFYRYVETAPSPTVYYGDTHASRAILLLEDLTHARQGDVLEGCSIEDTRAVLGAIAPFHARYWDRDSAAAWLPREELEPQARQVRFDERMERFVSRHRHAFPDDVLRIAERLRTRLADVILRLDEGPQTVIHGDLHLDNLLFDAGPERRAVVLDWQVAGVGSAARDLVLFVFGSLGVEDRRAAGSELLEEYLARLIDHGVRGYDRARLRDDCRLALLLWFSGVVGWLVGPEPDLGRARALREAALSDGRLVAAFHDYEVALLLEP